MSLLRYCPSRPLQKLTSVVTGCDRQIIFSSMNSKRCILTQSNLYLSATRFQRRLHVLQSRSPIKVMKKTPGVAYQVLPYPSLSCRLFSTHGKDYKHSLSCFATLVSLISIVKHFHSSPTRLE